ncbi:hypothetical protein ACFZDB_21760 [Streptomyces luteogriseus]|uniref:hypothetical protein n=1 Tax=Streptomyces luteogriseus TaxID=68233 RepID=UPI0036E1EB52
MIGTAEVTSDGVSATAADGTDRCDGVREEHTANGFLLSRERPGTAPVYYRVGYGRLEWGADAAAFRPDADRPVPEPGTLLALVHGLVPPPDATPLSGVRRLTLGTRVEVSDRGVTVSRRPPTLPSTGRGLLASLGDVLTAGPDDYAIAYSGGLSSAYLAMAALSAGHRPQLLYADLGLSGERPPLPEIPGLRTRTIPLDVFELLDHHRVSGAGVTPPLPDQEFPRRLAERLFAAAGLPLAAGTLLEDIVSSSLSQTDRGRRDWRLLTCEPFHLSGTLGSLREATSLLAEGVVRSDSPVRAPSDAPSGDAQPVDSPTPPPTPLGRRDLPGLTRQGRLAFQSAQQAALSVWKNHLDFLGPVLGRLEAGLAARVPTGGPLILPVTQPGVLGAVDAIPPGRMGRIRGGLYQNHQPLRELLDKHRVRGLRRSTSSFDLRLAAAAYLHRESGKIAAELERECALGDLGLVDPRVVAGLVREGPHRSDHALPLLRLLWIDQWLRKG